MDRARCTYRVRLIRNNNFQPRNPTVAHTLLSSSPTVIIILLRRAVAENGRITRAAVSRAVAGVTYLKSVSTGPVPPGVKLVSQRLMRERVSPGPLSSGGLSRKRFVPTGNGDPTDRWRWKYSPVCAKIVCVAHTWRRCFVSDRIPSTTGHVPIEFVEWYTECGTKKKTASVFDIFAPKPLVRLVSFYSCGFRSRGFMFMGNSPIRFPVNNTMETTEEKGVIYPRGRDFHGGPVSSWKTEKKSDFREFWKFRASIDCAINLLFGIPNINK